MLEPNEKESLLSDAAHTDVSETPEYTDVAVDLDNNDVLELQNNLQATIKELADAMDAENMQRQMVLQAEQRDQAERAIDVEMSHPLDSVEHTPSADFEIHDAVTVSATSTSGVTDNLSLDELLAALNISTLPRPDAVDDSTTETTNDMPTQVPRIENLWQELGEIWPVITHHPEVVTNIEELWSRLKEAHHTGTLGTELSQLYSKLTDDDTANPAPTTAPLRNSDEVADIVSRILAGVKTRDIINDTGPDASVAAPLAKQGTEEFDVDNFLQRYAMDAEPAPAATVVPKVTENRQKKPNTGNKLTISADELAILENILGDRLDRNAIGAPALDHDADEVNTGGHPHSDSREIVSQPKPNGTDPAPIKDVEQPARHSRSTHKSPSRKAHKSSATHATPTSPVPYQPAHTVASADVSALDTNETDDDADKKSYWLPRVTAALVIVGIAWLWLSSGSEQDLVATQDATRETRNGMSPTQLAENENSKTLAESKAEYRRAAEQEHARVVSAAAARKTVPNDNRPMMPGAGNDTEAKRPRELSTTEVASQIPGTAGGTGAPSGVTGDHVQAPPAVQSLATGSVPVVPANSSELTQNTAYNTLTETLNLSTQNIQNLVDGSLDRLRTSTQNGLQDLSQRVNRLEDAIGKLHAAIESLLHQNNEARADQNRSLSALGERLDGLETAQKKAFNARIERDKEGVTIVLTEPRAGRTGESGADGTYDVIVHTVVKGDTLWDIAAKYINDPFRYPELAKLSKIKNPDRIFPGDRVRIVRRYVTEP